MKREYDFSGVERGKFYRPNYKIRLPGPDEGKIMLESAGSVSSLPPARRDRLEQQQSKALDRKILIACAAALTADHDRDAGRHVERQHSLRLEAAGRPDLNILSLHHYTLLFITSLTA